MKRKLRGFTLLELLVVMGIMVSLSTVAVTSYFAAMRGMARRSALQQLAGTLTLARQRACMDGVTTCVMIYNEVVGETSNSGDDSQLEGSANLLTRPAYIVCKQLGRITCIPKKGYWADEFTDLGALFNVVYSTGNFESEDYKEDSYKRKHKLEAMQLFNMTQGGWSYVYPNVLCYDLHNRTSATRPQNSSGTGLKKVKYTVPVYAFMHNDSMPSRTTDNRWEISDAYGTAVEPIQFLPTGFCFKSIEGEDEDNIIMVRFTPDGKAKVIGDSAGKVTVKEINSGATMSVEVESDGTISWNGDADAWN